MAEVVQRSQELTASKGLRLIVRDREGVTLDVPAKAVSSKNKVGIFDVLKDHAQFISIIDEVLVVHREDGSTQEVPVSQGLVKVRGNVIKVFLGVRGGSQTVTK